MIMCIESLGRYEKETEENEMKNPREEKQTAKILLPFLLFPVIWAALLVAPFYQRDCRVSFKDLRTV